jgi:hypothetical protein
MAGTASAGVDAGCFFEVPARADVSNISTITEFFIRVPEWVIVSQSQRISSVGEMAQQDGLASTAPR